MVSCFASGERILFRLRRNCPIYTLPVWYLRDTMTPPGCVDACPGCRYRALTPEESDRRKTAWAREQLAPWADRLSPLRAPAQRWGYRRKILLHARRASGGWELGLLRRTGPRKHDTVLIPIPQCPLHDPALNSLLMDLRTLIPEGLPLVYVQASGALLTLVLKCAPSDAWRAWAASTETALRAGGALGLQLNWNPAAGRRALSSRHQERVFGPELVPAFDGLLHGAQSFRQQIAELENAALDAAETHLAGAQLRTVVDLYSGAGGSLSRWRRRGWRAVGVELGGEACRAAELNAPGALVLKGRVEQRLPQLREFLSGAPFVLYTNPPREGHAPEPLEWIREAKPARIAYLSCNTRTLARDLAQLADYRVESLEPFDFFPQTDHVETLALLHR